ncbi:MAG TPA: hypothetical protein VHO01_09775 [Jatrophihabitans sp.]|nr:hypothetical protein [Jatrophihabitans sp.]
MPSRRSSKWTRPARPLSTVRGERVEGWRGRDYRVRSVATPGGPYRCPGCDQLLAPGSSHVVAWPAEDAEAADRRHWHTSCWAARDVRSPGVQRSRNAPRYG